MEGIFLNYVSFFKIILLIIITNIIKKKRDHSHISETRSITLISFHDISDFNRREIRTSKQEFSPLSRETIRFRLLNA